MDMTTLTLIFGLAVLTGTVYMISTIAYRVITFPIRVVVRQVIKEERRNEQSTSPLWNSTGRFVGKRIRDLV